MYEDASHENRQVLRRKGGASQIQPAKYFGKVSCGMPKTEWALQRGGRSAHPFSWLLSSPQQPLETEDPPTVSLAPQYTPQRLCRAIEFFGQRKRLEIHYILLAQRRHSRPTMQLFHSPVCKFFSIEKRGGCEQRLITKRQRRRSLSEWPRRGFEHSD